MDARRRSGSAGDTCQHAGDVCRTDQLSHFQRDLVHPARSGARRIAGGVILVPTFLPVVKQMNIELIHYSIVVTAATGIGLFLPPIGVGLFVACGIAGITIDRVTREMMPYVTMLSFGLLLVIAFPWLTLVLPRVFGL